MTRVREVSTTTAIDNTAHITISVADVVLVSGVELVIRKPLERLTPKENALLEGETDAFQEERILESTKVFQVVVLSQVHMQTAHTEGEMV